MAKYFMPLFVKNLLVNISIKLLLFYTLSMYEASLLLLGQISLFDLDCNITILVFVCLSHTKKHVLDERTLQNYLLYFNINLPKSII